MFRRDIDSCTLAKPPLVSLGPDVAHGQADSAGVVYMNVTAYSDIFAAFIEDAASNAFSTDSVAIDQNMLLRYIQGFSTLLPDLYNYKPYWGVQKPVIDLPFINMPSGEPVIVHMQGPKPHRAVCALKEYRKQKPSQEQLKAHEWQGRAEALKACNLDNPRHVYFSWDLEAAYGADEGEMYFQVAEEYDRHRETLRHAASRRVRMSNYHLQVGV